MAEGMMEQERESSDLSLFNESRNDWVPHEGTSTISSCTGGTDDSSSDANHNPSSLSLLSDQSDRRSSETDLLFSKRLSGDLSDEGQQLALKPAKFFSTKRKSERILPVSRLRFSSVGLVGRDKEKEILKACLKRVAGNQDEKQKGSRELVLISGLAGTGKTALASAVMKPVEKLGGLFVKGKFDLYLRDEPYSGIAAACREICGSILLLRNDESFEKIRTELIDKLGSENLHLLINIVPELSEVVGDELFTDETMKTQSSEETKARLNYAFRILLRVVTTHFSSLVILLDDIQWSDAATLSLLQVLIADRDNPSLMVMGVYRSNEVDESHPLYRVITELKRAEEQGDFNLSTIEVGNLNVSQVNEIIMLVLSIDEPAKTLGLADVCHKRSHGNVYSLLVFLEMLHEEGLLRYSIGSFSWSWDEQTILSETAATANVVDLMKQKIEKLPSSVSQRLSIAACLGFSFEPRILKSVWDSIAGQQEQLQEGPSDGNSEEENRLWFARVEEEGFLEKDEDGTAYRWVHDKVQEAAMSLVPDVELQSLKVHVGKILVNELDDKDVDSYIFTIVNLLEGEAKDDDAERIQLAKLSLLASKKASELSAFESSGRYATIGILVLPKDMWSNHYELTLDLYSTAAEAACYLGSTEELQKCYDEVLNQKDRPLIDKLRVCHAMISYLGGALGRPSDAIDLLVKILSQFGIRFPKRKGSRLASTMLGILKAKRKMNSLQPEDITNLPAMTDPVHLEIMRLLDQLFLAAYLAKSDLMPLAIFESTKLTLENGLSEYSAPTFACLALLIGAALGDMELSSKTGNFASLAMRNVASRNLDARAILFLDAFVFCWTDRITSMEAPLLKAYETGLAVGDNENACWSIAQYIVIGFQSGRALETVEADCKIYLVQMLEFKRETVHTDICIYSEMIQNLMGYSNGDPTKMKSEQCFVSQTDHTVLGVFYSCQCILYMYFGEYKKAANLALKRGDTYAKGVPGHVWIMIETFTRAMVLYAAARMTGKRVYAKHAKKVHKTIKTWLQKGNPNVKHYDLLLNAESSALKGNLDEAEGWYQSAIVSATRQGSVHESAFASERYGEFLLNERQDPEEARHKFDDAIRRYGEWGAARKVRMLTDAHQNVWQKPSHVFCAPNRVHA